LSRRDRKKNEGSGWVVTRGCPRCGRREDECACDGARADADATNAEILLRLRMEKRRGKPVTIVSVQGVAAGELRELAKELKSRFATGGSLKGEEIELQGEHRERLRAMLVEKGFRVKG
jgi:translation initiation factor 1